MSFSKISSAQIDGLAAKIITIETDITEGLYAFSLVGLPDKAVEESHDRVSSALKNSGFKSYKQKNEKVVISLAPAELKKTGPVFDLGVALGYLLASEEIDFDPQGKIFLGELSLNGELRPITGTLSIVEFAKSQGFSEVYLPASNVKEAALVKDTKIFGIKNLRELIVHLDPAGEIKRSSRAEGVSPQETTVLRTFLPQPPTDPKEISKRVYENVFLDDIRGQDSAKRALEIAASGGHNVLLFGPPGTGKTLLAKAFASLLPDLTHEDALEVTSIHSAVGILKETFISRPPFRSPHHTSSYVSIVGGGAYPQPGEITLAHRGVLFLDEFPEFDRRVIESLREPLEEKHLIISRSQKTAHFPADIILVAAMNPCPCGNRGSNQICRCTPGDLARYERKLSGPILDRIDLWVEVGKIEASQLRADNKARNKQETESAKKRIRGAIDRQRERLKKSKRSRNAELGPKEIGEYIDASEEVYSILEQAVDNLGLSARGYHKILKVAQTIADLESSKRVEEAHILEALQYRQKSLFL